MRARGQEKHLKTFHFVWKDFDKPALATAPTGALTEAVSHLWVKSVAAVGLWPENIRELNFVLTKSLEQSARK